MQSLLMVQHVLPKQTSSLELSSCSFMYLLKIYTIFLLGMWSYVYNYSSPQFWIQVLIRYDCTCKLSHLSELKLRKYSNPHINKIGHLAISAESSKFRLGPKRRRGYKICEDPTHTLPTLLF